MCFLLQEGGGGGVKIMYIVNETLSTSGEGFIFVWQAAVLQCRICGRGVVEEYCYRQRKEMCYLLQEGGGGGGGGVRDIMYIEN